MAPRRKLKRAAASAETPEKGVPAMDKIAGVLALIATRRMDTDDAALKLDAIGFSASEISALLDVGPNYVNVARHRKKDRAGKARKKG
jgi:hypothetical protein